MTDADFDEAIATHLGWCEIFRNAFEGIHGEALKNLASVDATTCPLGPWFSELAKLGAASPIAAGRWSCIKSFMPRRTVSSACWSKTAWIWP